MGQIHEGRLAAGEKSLRSASPCCIVASHVVNRARDACCPESLTCSGWFKVAADALLTCLGRLGD